MKTTSLILIIASFFFLVACGGNTGNQAGSGNPPAPQLSSIQVAPGSASIAAGTGQQFTATGKFSDGSSQDMTSSVQWGSSDSNVAAVKGAGMVNGLAAGQATVSAQSGNLKGTAALTVTSASVTLTAVTVAPASASVAVNSAQQFTATGSYSDGSTHDITSSVQWSSSNTSVASISSAGLAAGLVAGSVTITAQSGSLQGTATLNVTSSAAAADLTAITVSPATPSLPVDTAQQFTATGSYSDGSSRDLTALVAWNSSSTTAATVDMNGLATGLAAGTTTISATLNGITGSTLLTVTAPSISYITVTPVGLTLGVGINQQFTATATYSDGSSQDLVSGVTWTSSSTSVATVDNTGLATTAGAGQATLTATFGSFSDTTTLTVVPANLISIEVTPATISVAQGTAQQFTAVGTFDDGSTQVLTSVTWSSSATNVASINASGMAAAGGTGQVTITAASGSVSGTASLTVTGASLVSIAVTPTDASMAIGTTRQFTATGTFSDSSTQDVTASALWSSSSPAVAAISNQGLATSFATGSSTITAVLGSASGSTTLTVANVHLVSIAISPSNPRIAKGTSIKFTATGTFSDGSTSTNLSGLTWKTSKHNIVQIRRSGIAHGKKAGSVTVSATASGVTGTTTLTVGTGTLTSIAITPASPSVSLGATEQFTATGTFSDGTTQDITFTTHFSSSAASVATIANAPSVAGVATTRGTGTTVIGANSRGVTTSTTLTVQ